MITRIVLLIKLLIVVACATDRQPDDHMRASDERNMIEVLLDPACLTEFTLQTPAGVRAAYAQNGYQHLWVSHDTLVPAAFSLHAFIRESARNGLDPEDYHIGRIGALMESLAAGEAASTLDLLLTDAFLALYFHLAEGRLQPGTALPWPGVPPIPDAITSLWKASRGNSVAATLAAREPVHADYIMLKEALGEKLAQLHSSRNLLVSRRKNMLEAEARQIVVNMERWRWEDPVLPDRYVRVNIPDYTMRVVERDTVQLTSDVIVGSADTPTPVLNSRIECFTIYPYWHVPRTIAIGEILPQILKDTSYLRRNRFELINSSGRVVAREDIPWDELHKTFPYVLRQREGSENSMGVLKFHFDNPFAVYLHDTNSKTLFNRAERALSHGCIRVDKAMAFARYLIRGDSAACTYDDLDYYLMFGERKEVTLTDPISLYIGYFTYNVENRILTLLPDVYGLDAEMMPLWWRQSPDHTDK